MGRVKGVTLRAIGRSVGPEDSQYLLRSQRGGVMQPRWNLILPESLVGANEPDKA